MVLEKVLKEPMEERLRHLKASNERVQRELLTHPEAVALLRLAGFEVEASGDLVLAASAPLGKLQEAEC